MRELAALAGRRVGASLVLPEQDEAALAWFAADLPSDETITLNEDFFLDAEWYGRKEMLCIRFRHGAALYIGGIRTNIAKPS